MCIRDRFSLQSFSYYISPAETCLRATTETNYNLKRMNTTVRACYTPADVKVMRVKAIASTEICVKACNAISAYRNANACRVILGKINRLAYLYKSLCF